MVLAITAPGPSELIVILVLAVLLFGAKKLPELGSSVGQSIKNFKKGVSEADDDDASAVDGEAEHRS
jgi:sec-independent protein translocase protein TatA